MRMRKSEPIEKIRKRYKREWLLISIPKTESDNAQPKTGRLVIHSPHKDDVYEVMMKWRGPAYLVYSEDGLPAGYATAF